MCRHIHAHRHSIFCFLPPYVLRNIAQNGTAAQRAAALLTMGIDSTFRALRTASQNLRFRPGRLALPSAVAPAQLSRTIHDAGNQQTLPGAIVRTEGQGDTGDPAVDEAYHGLGATFDFFAEAYDRNSIDDEGMPLSATVHYGDRYDNAFWNGERMVFGDGEIFNRFTSSLDVIGHELAHGVTEDEAGLFYMWQSGALNESMSDVFGSLVKQYRLKQKADEADWLIGKDLIKPGTNGQALRSMKAPGTAFDDDVLGKDPQPAHMKNFVHTFQDNGGVHINSGIPNHAFYHTAVKLGGHAWEKAGRIWYDALRHSAVRPNTGFKRFARVTRDVAGQLFGAHGSEQKAVIDGWAKVGIKV